MAKVAKKKSKATTDKKEKSPTAGGLAQGSVKTGVRGGQEQANKVMRGTG